MDNKTSLSLPYIDVITSLSKKQRRFFEASTLSKCQLNNHPFFIPLTPCDEYVYATVTISHIQQTPNTLLIQKSCQ